MSENPFNSDIFSRVERSLSADTSAGAANALFGDLVDEYLNDLRSLRRAIKRANMNTLYRTYVSEILFFSLTSTVFGFFAGVVFSLLQGYGPIRSLRYILGVPISLGLIVSSAMYLYPGSKARRRANDIDENLPFAVNHISAISSSGVPPDSMFALLAEFEEYGEIQVEAKSITRRVNVFGEDITTAVREVADRTPNDRFADFLYGLISTIETGGNLNDYIDEQAGEQLFQYNIRKEKEIDRISTYASFYTALLIAAPVFLVVILAIVNLLQRTIAGFRVKNLMFLGIHVVIPVVNTLFIGFLVARTD